MKLLACLLFLGLVVPGFVQAQVAPPIPASSAVTAPAWPRGQDTPEGAAADLARAFIARDADLFRAVSLPPGGNAEYGDFLAQVSDSMKEEAIRPEPSPGGPKEIIQVFAARHLSLEGPASYGYAMFGYHDVMFVDVVVVLHAGVEVTNRTLVIKKSSGKWYVHPLPAVSPLLSAGLNEETPSTQGVGK